MIPRVVVLGGGPAGLGAAYRLRREAKAEVVLLERGDTLGGNAGRVRWNGHDLDFGSHRLHPSCDAEILADVKSLLGDDLLDRPRHGRIRLLGRWVHFPLKAGDLLRHAPKSFLLEAARDAATKPFRSVPKGEENFATVLQASLGPAICRDFYLPYARKIWGRDPAALAAVQARRRVAAGSPVKLLRKVLGQVPGLKKKGAGRFFYPRRGFGQICEAYGAAAAGLGADVRTGHTVTQLRAPASPGGPWTVRARGPGGESEWRADHVWSTIPVTALARMLDPAPPADVIDATRRIAFRAMVLAYVELDVAQFTEYDAHYFPGADVRLTRLSEPRNYSLATEPEGRTVLCAEIPCDVGDAVWEATPDALGRMVAEDLERSGIPLPKAPRATHAARLPQAYPVYLTGYEEPLAAVDRHLASRERLLTYGRQGLFAHDNTHHALAMAYAAVGCLDGATFDVARWERHRAEFAKHVVED